MCELKLNVLDKLIITGVAQYFTHILSIPLIGSVPASTGIQAALSAALWEKTLNLEEDTKTNIWVTNEGEYEDPNCCCGEPNRGASTVLSLVFGGAGALLDDVIQGTALPIFGPVLIPLRGIVSTASVVGAPLIDRGDTAASVVCDEITSGGVTGACC